MKIVGTIATTPDDGYEINMRLSADFPIEAGGEYFLEDLKGRVYKIRVDDIDRSEAQPKLKVTLYGKAEDKGAFPWLKQ